MIYLDHHATTPIDPKVIEALVPLMKEHYANASNTIHSAGRAVADLIDSSLASIAANLGASSDEIVVTSGATESNNLAILGYCLHPSQKRRKVISVMAEHLAVIEPVVQLERMGYLATLMPVRQFDHELAGEMDMDRFARSIDDSTALVSVMLANNEIGTIQSLTEIAALCRKYGVILHTDATQAVGHIPVDVNELDVDLMSFSAHKFYGPKGVGGLYVRSRPRNIRLLPQIFGGTQQKRRRAGTLNSIGIIGMAMALQSTLDDMTASCQEPEHRLCLGGNARIRLLRNHLHSRLVAGISGLRLNGTPLEPIGKRLPGNLNCCFYPVHGQSLMLAVPELAVSTSSACTAVDPAPSHVLATLGLSDDEGNSSLRFGLGRFNTLPEIDQAADWLIEAVQRLTKLL